MEGYASAGGEEEQKETRNVHVFRTDRMRNGLVLEIEEEAEKMKALMKSGFILYLQTLQRLEWEDFHHRLKSHPWRVDELRLKINTHNRS